MSQRHYRRAAMAAALLPDWPLPGPTRRLAAQTICHCGGALSVCVESEICKANAPIREGVDDLQRASFPRIYDAPPQPKFLHMNLLRLFRRENETLSPKVGTGLGHDDLSVWEI